MTFIQPDMCSVQSNVSSPMPPLLPFSHRSTRPCRGTGPCCCFEATSVSVRVCAQQSVAQKASQHGRHGVRAAGRARTEPRDVLLAPPLAHRSAGDAPDIAQAVCEVCRWRASERRSLRARAGRARPSRPARLPKCVCARYYAATAHVATAARLPQSRGVRAEMAAVKVCAGDKQRMNTGRLSGQRMSCGRVWKNICQE